MDSLKLCVISVDVESDAAAFADPQRSTLRGIKEGLPQLLDFFTNNGYPITLFVSCDILCFLDIDFLKEKSKCIEIASHGFHHPYPPFFLDSFSLPELIWEISESKRRLEEVFGVDVKGFRSPGGYINERIMRIISNYYEYDSSMLIGKSQRSGKLKIQIPYHPSAMDIHRRGALPLLEIPIASTSFLFQTITLNGAYIRNLPLFFFRKLSIPVVVFDLHSQDCVPFRHWKYITVKYYFNKLIKLLNFYESRGYRFVTASSVAKIFKNLKGKE